MFYIKIYLSTLQCITLMHSLHFFLESLLAQFVSHDAMFLIFIVFNIHMRMKASARKSSHQQIQDVSRETSDKRFLSRRYAFGTRLKIYEITFDNALRKSLPFDDRADRNGAFYGNYHILIFFMIYDAFFLYDEFAFYTFTPKVSFYFP